MEEATDTGGRGGVGDEHLHIQIEKRDAGEGEREERGEKERRFFKKKTKRNKTEGRTGESL